MQNRRNILILGAGGNPYPLGVNYVSTLTASNNIGAILPEPSGQCIYFGYLNGDLAKYNMTTANDLSSAGLHSVWGGGSSNTCRGLEWNDSGTRFMILESSGLDTVFYRNISTAYEAIAANVVNIGSALNVEGYVEPASGMRWEPSGLVMRLSDLNPDRILKFNFSQPFDTGSTMTYGGSEGGAGYNLLGFDFADNGNKYFTLTNTASGGNQVRMYNLSTPYVTSTRTYVSNLLLPFVPWDIRIVEDGRRMYISENLKNKVHQYTLNPAFEI